MSTVPQHADRAHAELSPSSASRWLACPGSVLLSRGVPGTSSSFADEGTAAHQVAENCLRTKRHPRDLIGTSVTVNKREWPVTPDMAGYVSVYVDHVRDLQQRAGSEGVLEHRFSLASLNPPAPMHGTADFVLHSKKERRVYVCDLKYGAGVLVDVMDNAQLQYYALGVLSSMNLTREVDEVHLTIVQPRVDHDDGYIRTVVLPTIDVLLFGEELLEGAQRALEPNAPLAAGKHCKFCKAKPFCPEVKQKALAAAGEEFDIEEDPAKFVLPDPRLLPVEVVASYLPKLQQLEDWIHGLRSWAHAELEAGRQVPGYKLVAKRANRSWKVSEQDILKHAKKNGLKKDQCFQPGKLLSPAQLEKLIDIPQSFVQKISSGTTLAEESDSRPAVAPQLTSGEEFFSDGD